jgi:hypothetical protein
MDDLISKGGMGSRAAKSAQGRSMTRTPSYLQGFSKALLKCADAKGFISVRLGEMTAC